MNGTDAILNITQGSHVTVEHPPAMNGEYQTIAFWAKINEQSPQMRSFASMNYNFTGGPMNNVTICATSVMGSSFKFTSFTASPGGYSQYPLGSFVTHKWYYFSLTTQFLGLDYNITSHQIMIDGSDVYDKSFNNYYYTFLGNEVVTSIKLGALHDTEHASYASYQGSINGSMSHIRYHSSAYDVTVDQLRFTMINNPADQIALPSQFNTGGGTSFVWDVYFACETSLTDPSATYLLVGGVLDAQTFPGTFCPEGFYGPRNSTTGLITSCPTNCSDTMEYCKICDGYNGATTSIDSGCIVCDSAVAISDTNCNCQSPSVLSFNATAQFCHSCSGDNCLTCHTNDTCTQCQAGYYYYPPDLYHCYSSCPVGWYASTGMCYPCDSSCSTCYWSGTNACTGCKNGTFFNQLLNSCVDASSCPAGEIADVLTNACSNCTSICTTCTTTPYNCTGCVSGYYLLGNECVQVCPKGKYANSTTSICQDCTSTCETCSSQTECTSCKSGKFLNSSGVCDTSCPAGTYQLPSNQVCMECNQKCATCTGEGSDSCQSCQSPYFLKGSTCQESCPMEGYYTNSTNSTCVPCDPTCFSCSMISTNCTLCPTGSYLSGSTCVSACASNQFTDSGGQCHTCHASCANCTNNGETNCQQCVAPTYFLMNTTCGSSCPPAHFANTLNQKCDPCTVPCVICTSASQCSACEAGFKLINGQCNGETYFTTSANVVPSLTVNSVNLAALPTPLSAFTFESWFQSTENTPSTTNSITFGLYPWKFKRDTTAQVYNLVYKSSLSFCLTDVLPGKVWYQFAFSLDPTNGIQCYISGKPQQVGTANQTNVKMEMEKLQELTLGFSQFPFGSEAKYYGKFRELRYWKILRAEKDITNFLNVQFDIGIIPTDLISYWKLIGEANTFYLQDYAVNGPIYDSSVQSPSFQVKTQMPLVGRSLIICPSSQYMGLQGNDTICLDCHSECLSCIGPAITECTRCNSGKFLDSTDSLCKTSCPTATFQDTQLNTCTNCNSNCATCYSSADNCPICKPNKFRVPGSNSCFTQCQSGFYGNLQNIQCIQEPTLAINSPLNGSIYLSTEFINVVGEVNTQAGEDPKMFRGVWKVLRVSDGLDVGPSMIKPKFGDEEKFEVHLDRNIFEINHYYKIQFSIEPKDSTMYTTPTQMKEVTIMIGFPPQNGSCVTDLAMGQARITNFNLSAVDWVDADGIKENRFYYSSDGGQNYFPIKNQIASQNWISHQFPIFYKNTTILIKCEVVDFHGFSNSATTSVLLYLNDSQVLNLPVTAKIDLDSYSIGTIVGTNNFMKIANDVVQLMSYFSGQEIQGVNTTMKTERLECDGSTCNLKGECITHHARGTIHCKCNTGYSGQRCQISDQTSIDKIIGLWNTLLVQFNQNFYIDMNPQYARHFVQLVTSFPDMVPWNATTILTNLIKNSVQSWGSQKQTDIEVRSTMQAISSIMDAIWINVDAGVSDIQLKANMYLLEDVLDDLALSSLQNMGEQEYKKQFTTPGVAIFMHRITKDSILKINTGNVEQKVNQNLIKIDSSMLSTLNLPSKAAILTREWVRNPYELYNTSVCVPMVTVDIVNMLNRGKIYVNSTKSFKMEFSISKNTQLQEFSQSLNRFSTLKKDHIATRNQMISEANLNCVYFNKGTNKWTSEGCSYELLTDTHLICKCTHMSDFSGVYTYNPVVQANSTASNASAVAKNTPNYFKEFPLKLSGWPVVVIYLFCLLTTISTGLYKDRINRFKLNIQHVSEDLNQTYQKKKEFNNEDYLEFNGNDEPDTPHQLITKQNLTQTPEQKESALISHELLISQIPSSRDIITHEFNHATTLAVNFKERTQVFFKLIMKTQIPFTYIMRSSNLISRFQQIMVYYSGIAFRMFMVYIIEVAFTNAFVVNVGGTNMKVDGQSLSIFMIIPINIMYTPIRMMQTFLVRPGQHLKKKYFLNQKMTQVNDIARKFDKAMRLGYILNTAISLFMIFGMVVTALLCSLFWSQEQSTNFTIILMVYVLLDLVVGIGFNIIYQSVVAALVIKIPCLKGWYICCERQRRYRSLVP